MTKSPCDSGNLMRCMGQSVRLWSLELRLCLRRSHICERFIKENGTVRFHIIHGVTVHVDLLSIKMATMNLICECIIVVLTS